MTAPSPAAVYLDGLQQGILRFQRCVVCAQAVFYPRVACPHCGAAHLSWSDSAGVGTIYATTTTRSRSGDYNVALIDLDEGFRMMGTVRDDVAHEPRIGERVVAVIPPGCTAESLSFRREDVA